MRYGLRSLVIVVTFAPPVLAGLYFLPVQTLATIVIPLLTIWIVHILIKNDPGAAR
jgi:hypothetical protein